MTAEKKKIEGWTAKRVLEAYGLRRLSGPLRVPGKRGAGGSVVMDEATQAMFRVSEVTGFEIAKPAIDWVHSEGRELAEFKVNRSADFKVRVLWGVGEGFPLRLAAKGHYDRFLEDLTASLEEKPFVPEMFDQDDEASRPLTEAERTALNARDRMESKTA
jgi:hypothetical protein